MARQPKIEELAWAAGLFEGEGSIHANHIKGRVYLLLNLSSTDEDVVLRFHSIMGCGKVYGPYVEDNPAKPRYSWHAKNKADAHYAAALLEPWLCSRRWAKLAEVREKVAAQPPPQTGIGVTLSPERRKKLSDSMKRWWAEATPEERRRVIALQQEGRRRRKEATA